MTIIKILFYEQSFNQGNKKWLIRPTYTSQGWPVSLNALGKYHQPILKILSCSFQIHRMLPYHAFLKLTPSPHPFSYDNWGSNFLKTIKPKLMHFHYHIAVKTSTTAPSLFFFDLAQERWGVFTEDLKRQFITLF